MLICIVYLNYESYILFEIILSIKKIYLYS